MLDAVTVDVEIAPEDVFDPAELFVNVAEVLIEVLEEIVFPVETAFAEVCIVVYVEEDDAVVFCLRSSNAGASRATTATILPAVFK